jgi:RNA polymerase sigma factor (sigma-70 family)
MPRHAVVFKTQSDEQELIKKAQKGCRDSMTILYERFLPLIKSEARKVSNYHKNVDFEDAFGQACLCFVEAIQNYDYKKAKGRGMNYWAKTCISLAMIDFWKYRMTIKTPVDNEVLRQADDRLRNQITAARECLTQTDRMPASGPIKESSLAFIDRSDTSPVEAASKREELVLMKTALRQMRPEWQLLIQSRLNGLSYEQSGTLVNETFDLERSVGREAVRQTTERALTELKNRMFSLMGRKMYGVPDPVDDRRAKI